MSDITPVSTPSVAEEISASRSRVFGRLLRNPTGLVSLIILTVMVLAAVLAPLIAPMDPTAVDIRNTLGSPSASNLLGTDSAGRDVLSRLLYAARFSLAGAAWAVLVAALIGVSSGLIAGYFQRFFETASLWVISLLQALPGIVVLLAARSVLGPSLWSIMAVFGVILSPAFYRLTHSAVVGVRNELYVDAARVAGVGDASIIGRHILSVVRAPIIIQASILTGTGIAIQSGLDFLGVGDPSVPTWGQMLSDGFARMYEAPLLLVWPAASIAVTSIALFLLGNSLRDELERAAGGGRPRTSTADTETGTAPAAPATIVHPGERSAQALLAISDLRVGYTQSDGTTKEVVHGVSLSVSSGEILGLLGESGSGKTQTAWSILGLLPEGGRIVGGSIAFDGEALPADDPRAMQRLRGRRIAYIPQEPMSNLDPSFTVGSQLVEPLVKTIGLSRADAKARALALLTRVGIPNPERVFDSYPHQISGGMAQRVLIAGAVSCEPDLLIADEPTTALDVTIQAEILDLLRELQRDLSLSVLIVTHNFGVVADLCNRVAIMREGVIVETGPTQAVFDAPQHPYTQSLFAAILDEETVRGPLRAPAAPREGDPR